MSRPDECSRTHDPMTVCKGTDCYLRGRTVVEKPQAYRAIRRAELELTNVGVEGDTKWKTYCDAQIVASLGVPGDMLQDKFTRRANSLAYAWALRDDPVPDALVKRMFSTMSQAERRQWRDEVLAARQKRHHEETKSVLYDLST